MIYKKQINEKLFLSNSFSRWQKQILSMKQNEQKEIENKKKNDIKISKNQQITLIEKIKKTEVGTQIDKEKNEIENIDKINIINLSEKKDSGINADIPAKFSKINPQNQIDISYKYYKKVPLLKIEKENDVNIYNKNYISIEEIKSKNIKRINEILIKLINSRTTKNSVLKKYYTIWNRNANYLTLNEYAKIITDFCRNNLNKRKNYKKWKKICEKIILKEKIRIIKEIKRKYIEKNKIIDLIRITRINSINSKRRYLHYILLSWLAFAKNISKKKQNIKKLYENMLKN